MRHSLLVSCAAVMFAAACGSSTAPSIGTEAGRYVATSASGRTLPALTDSSAQEFGVLLADTLDLDGSGGVRRAFTIRRVSPSLRRDTVYRVTDYLQYRRLDTHVEIGSFIPCPANASCIANDTGTIAAGGIALTAYRYAAGVRVVLARIAP